MRQNPQFQIFPIDEEENSMRSSMRPSEQQRDSLHVDLPLRQSIDSEGLRREEREIMEEQRQIKAPTKEQ